MLRLEIFETEVKGSVPDTVVLNTMALEEAKLGSYDAGYAAGWEDAVAAQTGEQAQIKADLARNLQSLGFTYQEARMHILRALEPLLLEITGRLLPELARETIAPIVLDVLMPMAEKMADAPVTLVLNPIARTAVEALLEHATGMQLTLMDEPSLSEGQVYLRMGDAEVRVDLDRATAEITAAVRGFFDLPERKTNV